MYGFTFIEKACEDESYLEDLSGITKLKAAVEETNWALDGEEDEGQELRGSDDDDF